MSEGMTQVEKELRGEFESLIDALRERDELIEFLQSQREVSNQIWQNRVKKIEAERDYWIDQCDQQVALIAGSKP